jgi:hypothetical protein
MNLRKIIFIIVCVLGIALNARAAAVVCIGLNEYDHYPALKHAEDDASEMARLFQSKGHTVFLLTGEDVTVERVTQSMATQPDIIYFAGHAETGRLMVRDGDVALDTINGGNTTVLLDCCYVGRGLKTSGSVKVIAAAEYEAFEDGAHGLFTKHLLKWLKDGKSLVEDTLTGYLQKQLRAETGGWQKPVLGYL